MFGKLGYKARIYGLLKLEYPKNIFIGDNVKVGKYAWLAANPLTGNENCKLIIGDGTYLGHNNHIYATSKIEIGENVLMADRVYITDNLHSFEDITLPIIKQPIKQINDVFIGEGAWLGENVCVIGASVGKRSVIGANSVVTKDIPEYCVAVGAPARVIKRYSFDKNEWLKTTPDGEFIK